MEHLYMIITLSGYTPLIQNVVYSKPKPMPAIFANGSGRIVILDILLLMRYREPTDDEVVAHLQKTIVTAQKKQEGISFSDDAKAFDSYSDNFSNTNSSNPIIPINGSANNNRRLSCLEQKALEIPAEIRKQILDEDQEIITLVRQLTLAPPPNFELSPSYLYIKFGLLNPTYIAEQSLKGNLNALEEYESAFLDQKLQEKGFGEKVNIRIQLSNYNLIPKKEMDILVKHGMSGPEVAPAFAVSKEFYDRDDVQEIIDIVYHALPTPAHVKELTDVSKARLDELTLQPASGLMFALNLGKETERSYTKDSSDRKKDTQREEIIYH